jgi:hypothetical protein
MCHLIIPHMPNEIFHSFHFQLQFDEFALLITSSYILLSLGYCVWFLSHSTCFHKITSEREVGVGMLTACFHVASLIKFSTFLSHSILAVEIDKKFTLDFFYSSTSCSSGTYFTIATIRQSSERERKKSFNFCNITVAAHE